MVNIKCVRPEGNGRSAEYKVRVEGLKVRSRRHCGTISSMAYDHSRKAGNRGDVWKHSVLMALADVMGGNDRSFRYVECHAGAPIHELSKNGEWRGGAGTIRKTAWDDSPYAAMATGWLASNRYPASWVFVAERLAKRFQHVEIDLFDSDSQVKAQYGAPRNLRIPNNVRWRFRQADGYDEAARLTNADLVFLDPPYSPDAQKDWRRLRDACVTLMSNRTTFAAWYPFYWPTRPEELRDSTTCEAWEVTWARCGPRPSQNLKGCGMLVSPKLAALLPRIHADIRAVATRMNWTMLPRPERGIDRSAACRRVKELQSGLRWAASVVTNGREVP